MSGTAFTVDLIFKTQGGNQLQQATAGVDKLSNAAKNAQGKVNQASNNIRQFGQASSQASKGTNGKNSSEKLNVPVEIVCRL